MVKEVTVQQLKQLLDNNEDFQFIDVREKYEYDIANLGADLVPLGTINSYADNISKDKKVVIHCRSGKRSADAVALLQEKYGLNNLYNLKGGILAWADEIDQTVAKY